MLDFNFDPFPNLESERLTLTCVTNEDANDLFALRSDKVLMRFIPRPLANSLVDIDALLQMVNDGIANNESINWGIRLKNDSRLIGMIGYVRMSKENDRAEVGYILHGDYHGKGIMKEALDRVVEYGFTEMKLHSIEAIVDPENYNSSKVLENSNFIKEGHFKENRIFDGKFLDSVIYSRLAP